MRPCTRRTAAGNWPGAGKAQSKKLILIDTAGMGPRDVRLSEQLAALQARRRARAVLLALPAQGEGHALEEIVQAFAPLTPVACILTKVDEAASLGAVISTTLRHRLKSPMSATDSGCRRTCTPRIRGACGWCAPPCA